MIIFIINNDGLLQLNYQHNIFYLDKLSFDFFVFMHFPFFLVFFCSLKSNTQNVQHRADNADHSAILSLRRSKSGKRKKQNKTKQQETQKTWAKGSSTPSTSYISHALGFAPFFFWSMSGIGLKTLCTSCNFGTNFLFFIVFFMCNRCFCFLPFCLCHEQNCDGENISTR